MGRLYIATIDIAAAATQKDIFNIAETGAGDPPIALHEFLITTDIEQDANEVQIELELGRRTGAWTTGSGGAAVNGYPIHTGDTADNATVRTGDTTQATGGTYEIFGNYWVNNRIGLHVIFTPESRPTIQHDGTNDEGIILGLTAAPASTAWGGHIIYEELI
jgi:hypothetical protein